MKKTLVKLTAGLLSASILTGASHAVFAQQAGITAEQAKAIALADAKVNAKDVVFITNQRDVENGSQVYDIEFYVGNKEYDYEISAANGAIVQKDMDIENFVTPQQPKPTPKPQQPNTNTTGSTAKQAALKHANLKESQVQYLVEEVDYENGHKVIDVTFYSGGKEYSYEIDAQTNAILEWDVEYDEVDYDDYYEDRYDDDRYDDDDDYYDEVDYDDYYDMDDDD